jgi:arylsulfatase
MRRLVHQFAIHGFFLQSKRIAHERHATRCRDCQGVFHVNAILKGVIKLDVRDSKPDWTPYDAADGAEGRAERLIVLYDDTGLAAWSPFGGRINMPTLQKLATTASDTRSGTRRRSARRRDRPSSPAATITSIAARRSPRRGRLPRRRGPSARRVRDDRTGAAGQRLQHVLARQESQRADGGHRAGGSTSEWPLQKGFDRFYGFLGGETNNWYPDLVEDNSFIDQPYRRRGIPPVEGPRGSGARMLRDQRSPNPSKPGSCGSVPAPITRRITPKEYADKYKGKFDDGYEAYREWVLQRMIDKGICRRTRAHADQPDARRRREDRTGDCRAPVEHAQRDEKKLFSRMAEVYAGFSEYTDAQVGRIVEFLEQTGQIENTMIFYCADNGASGEGTRTDR